jgi:glycosyltransferase involved in cell wall biosynthesis
MKDLLVSIIIPAFNEEKNIKKIIREVRNLERSFPLEIIVVDDGSSDNTAASARMSGADRVIRSVSNLGKGGAFKKGIKAARGHYIIQIDADSQFQPKEIPLLRKSLLKGFDLVLGSRYQPGAKTEEESVNYVRRLGSYFLSFATSIASRTVVTDVMAGFKAFQADSLKEIHLKANDFGYEAEVVIRFAQAHKKICNVPITYKRRVAGRSNVNTFRDGFSVLKRIMVTSLSND